MGKSHAHPGSAPAPRKRTRRTAPAPETTPEVQSESCSDKFPTTAKALTEITKHLHSLKGEPFNMEVFTDEAGEIHVHFTLKK